MITKKISAIVLVLALVLSLSNSCRPQDNNPEELITTLKLNFERNGVVQTFPFKDVDGISGGNSGLLDTIQLDRDTSYTLSLEVLNESDYPAENITAEIKEEAVDHQFFFNSSAGLNLVQAYNDSDLSGRPIGLANNISTGESSSGTLRVNLKHQPGIKDGSQNTGESDIDVTFVVFIK